MCPLSHLSIYGCPLAKKRKALEKQPLEPAAKRRPFLTSCPGELEEDAGSYGSYGNKAMEVGQEGKEQGEVVEEDEEEDEGEREGDEEEEDGEVEDEFSEDNEEQGEEEEEEEEEEEIEVERTDTAMEGEQVEEEEDGMDEEEEEDGYDEEEQDDEGEEDEEEEEEEEQRRQQGECAVCYFSCLDEKKMKDTSHVIVLLWFMQIKRVAFQDLELQSGRRVYCFSSHVA